ncbi:MAG: hypothetical protein RIR49_1086 [Actinomycetota bacterium]
MGRDTNRVVRAGVRVTGSAGETPPLGGHVEKYPVRVDRDDVKGVRLVHLLSAGFEDHGGHPSGVRQAGGARSGAHARSGPAVPVSPAPTGPQGDARQAAQRSEARTDQPSRRARHAPHTDATRESRQAIEQVMSAPQHSGHVIFPGPLGQFEIWTIDSGVERDDQHDRHAEHHQRRQNDVHGERRLRELRPEG